MVWCVADEIDYRVRVFRSQRTVLSRHKRNSWTSFNKGPSFMMMWAAARIRQAALSISEILIQYFSCMKMPQALNHLKLPNPHRCPDSPSQPRKNPLSQAFPASPLTLCACLPLTWRCMNRYLSWALRNDTLLRLLLPSFRPINTHDRACRHPNFTLQRPN